MFNTILNELEADIRRRFTYSETGFLMRWLEEQNPKQAERLFKLVTETGNFLLF